MGGFLDAALGFPAVLFSFVLVVVVGYWLLVAFGGSDVDALDGADGGVGDLASGLGFGGVPITVVVSLVTVIAWFVSLVGTVLLDGSGLASPLVVVLSVLVLVVALVAALLGTRLLVSPLRRLFPDERAASRADFVGRTCVIRTGSVDHEFGQAEVTAEDGSSAIVQVRRAPGDAREPLGAGSVALIFDYDQTGEFFWVSPAPDLLS